MTLLISEEEAIINVTGCRCVMCRGQLERTLTLDWSDISEDQPLILMFKLFVCCCVMQASTASDAVTCNQSQFSHMCYVQMHVKVLAIDFTFIDFKVIFVAPEQIQVHQQFEKRTLFLSYVGAGVQN